jgi:signal transduction histidine kinase
MFTSWRQLSQIFGLGAAASRGKRKSPGLERGSTEVLARIAHEGQQPLSAALAAVQVVRQSADDVRRDRACVVLDRQLVRLSRLFEDLLEASRLRLAMTSLRLEQLDLRRLVEEVAEAMRPQVAEKHQRLDTHVPADPVWVEADSTRLHQVVSNLLVNGVRYTEPGGRLWVKLTRGSTEAVLTVSDTGQGIRADLLPRVFDPFMKGDVAPEHRLGVGLAIARQLVELHGGTIRASSAGPGNGSEFVVTLPIRGARHREGSTGAQNPAVRRPRRF